MRIGYNNSFVVKKQVTFKGEFEDVMAFSKTKNSPNEVDIASRKFFGPDRTIHPTVDRFNIIKQAVEQKQIKGAWYGLFDGIIRVWEPILKAAKKL
jgi:hypothetical protein